MKRITKILALVIAMVMCMSVSGQFAVFAAKGDEHTISVKTNDTHKYDVYQILVGDLSDGTLSNVDWGSSVTTPTEDGKINGKTAAEFAKSLEGLSGVDAVTEVGKYFTAGTNKVGQVDKDTPLTVAEGYYVMVDVTDPLVHDNGTTDTKALNVIKLVANVEVDKKWSTSTDTKTIVADTLGKEDDENTYDPGVDNDNVSIGDTVKYNIAATVPENADIFKEGTFFFVITDKLSTGLTFTNGSLEVYDGTTKLTEGTHYNVQYNINNNTFEVGLINAASYKGKTINVKYAAVLNENAVIGDAGNPNTSTVKFSNDPNKTYDGSPEDKEHPGFPDSTKDVPTGETPESETKTYTTGIEILKVDQDGKVLTGATFKISGESVKTVLKVTQTFTAADDGEYYKLKDGTYTKTAPSTEETMVEAEAGATAGYVEDETYNGEDKKEVGGKTYRPYDPETDGGKTIYVLKEGNSDLYDNPTTKYKKTETKTAENDAQNHEASQAVDANGLARFDGLGAGTYTISETVTPSGYNTVADVTLEVTFDEKGTPKFSADGATYEDGVLKITVENKKGTELPETGGIGTTMFYIIGTILVLGAGIVLVSRKKMEM